MKPEALRSNQDMFKEMILELKVANETLGKIELHTLNAADLSLESAVGMESFIAEIASLRDDLNKNYKPKEDKKKGGSLSAKDSSNLFIISKETASTAFHTFNMIGILESTYSLTKDILTTLQGNQLTNEENRLEDKKNKDKKQGTVAKENKNLKGGLEGGLGFWSILLGIGTAVLGSLAGFISGIRQVLDKVLFGVLGKIKNILIEALGINKLASKIAGKPWIFEPVVDSLNFLSKFFTNIARTIRASLYMFMRGDGIMALKELFPWIGKMEKYAVGIFKFVKAIVGITFKIGKVFGRFAGWVGIILTAVSSISDAFNEFEKTGDIGKAIEVGAVSLINAFTGDLLDLLKDAVSWFAGALGFEGIEKALDSFSFSDIIAEFFKRFIKTGQDIFEQLFQNFIDIFSDIGNAISSGDALSVAIEIFRGFLKTLVALPLDIVKGVVASVAGAIGANDIEKSIRSVSFAKMFGGTVTQTGAETDSSNKSLLSAAGDTTDLKRKQKEAKKDLNKAEKGIAETVTDTAEKLVPGANDVIDQGKQLLGISGDANEGFMNMLFKAYNENVGRGSASNITPNPSTIGSDISAIQSDTANVNMAAGLQPVATAPSGGGGGSNVSHNNSSVTYQNNNVPDRTSWMLRPIFGGL
jgi:hypothetical protein